MHLNRYDDIWKQNIIGIDSVETYIIIIIYIYIYR